MPDPSDTSGYKPVNRLDLTPAQERSLLKTMDRLRSEEAESRATTEREESEAISRQLDHRGTYRAVFALTRAEILSGRSPAAIRAGFRDIVAGREELAAAIHEAMEDALADRPPKW